MDAAELSHFMGEAPRANVMLLAVDPHDIDEVTRRLVDLPAVASVSRPSIDRGLERAEEGDVLVVNETRVRRARLHLRKETGGKVEVLLLDRLDRQDNEPGNWEAMVRPGRRLRPGTLLYPEGSTAPVIEIGDMLAEGTRAVRVLDPALAEAHGSVPLPPYIHHELADPERYQTVYARVESSAAAPTAGLHFTPELLEECRNSGAQVVAVELAVGLATFRPISTDYIEDHVMHSERYRVPTATLDACQRARRVIAIGTTAMRALETVAAGGPLEGSTELYVHGGYRFGLVDVLMTNFHLPRSSLLVLVEAFAGPRWREMYEVALAEGYRFLSFGDAMLLARAGQ